MGFRRSFSGSVSHNTATTNTTIKCIIISAIIIIVGTSMMIQWRQIVWIRNGGGRLKYLLAVDAHQVAVMMPLE